MIALLRSCSLLLGILLAGLIAGRALAAMDARVEPSHGQPGDRATLATIGIAGSYDSIAAAGDTVIYLVDPGVDVAAVCDTAQAHRLANLAWTDGVGRATFEVPAVAPGVYTFRALTPNAGCSRIGSDSGVLTFEVVPRAATGPAWGFVLALGLAGVLLLAIARMRQPM